MNVAKDCSTESSKDKVLFVEMNVTTNLNVSEDSSRLIWNNTPRLSGNFELGTIVLIDLSGSVELGTIVSLNVEWASIVSLKCNATRLDERRSPELWRLTDSGIAHSFGWGWSLRDIFWSWNETTRDADVWSDVKDASLTPLGALRETLRDDEDTPLIGAPKHLGSQNDHSWSHLFPE